MSPTNSPPSPPGNNDESKKQNALAAEESRLLRLHGNRLDSRDIFQAAREIIITHGDDVYRLRLTAQNKLILTK